MGEVQYETTTGAQAKIDAALAGAVNLNATRRGLVEQARKVVAETVAAEAAFQGASQSSSPASGELCAGLVGLLSGDVCRGLAFNLTKNAVTFTLFKACLFDAAGNLVAASADQAATFNGSGNGLKTVAFTSDYTAPSIATYRPGFLAVTSAGTYSINRASNGASLLSVGINSGAIPLVSQTGLTDVPATATFVGGNTGNAMYWLALYKP